MVSVLYRTFNPFIFSLCFLFMLFKHTLLRSYRCSLSFPFKFYIFFVHFAFRFLTGMQFISVTKQGPLFPIWIKAVTASFVYCSILFFYNDTFVIYQACVQETLANHPRSLFNWGLLSHAAQKWKILTSFCLIWILLLSSKLYCFQLQQLSALGEEIGWRCPERVSRLLQISKIPRMPSPHPPQTREECFPV